MVYRNDSILIFLVFVNVVLQYSTELHFSTRELRLRAIDETDAVVQTGMYVDWMSGIWEGCRCADLMLDLCSLALHYDDS